MVITTQHSPLWFNLITEALQQKRRLVTRHLQNLPSPRKRDGRAEEAVAFVDLPILEDSIAPPAYPARPAHWGVYLYPSRHLHADDQLQHGSPS